MKLCAGTDFKHLPHVFCLLPCLPRPGGRVHGREHHVSRRDRGGDGSHPAPPGGPGAPRVRAALHVSHQRNVITVTAHHHHGNIRPRHPFKCFGVTPSAALIRNVDIVIHTNTDCMFTYRLFACGYYGDVLVFLAVSLQLYECIIPVNVYKESHCSRIRRQGL